MFSYGELVIRHSPAHPSLGRHPFIFHPKYNSLRSALLPPARCFVQGRKLTSKWSSFWKYGVSRRAIQKYTHPPAVGVARPQPHCGLCNADSHILPGETRLHLLRRNSQGFREQVMSNCPRPPQIPKSYTTERLKWLEMWEWARRFTGLGKCKKKVKSLSRVQLFAAPWTVAYQVPPSTGFSRQEYWIVISFPRGSSRPRDRTQVFCIAGRRFTIWATREAKWLIRPK